MRHVLRATVSKLVKQLLTISEKPKRLGSGKSLAPEKVKLAYLAEMCGYLLVILLLITP